MIAVLITALASLSLPQNAAAKECDNYTNRDRPVRDAAEVLDRRTNELINAALDRANRSKKGCSRKTLFNALDDKLGATPLGVLETWAERTNQLERLQNNANGPESIYHGFNIFKYPLLTLTGIDNSLHLAGHVVGTDKLGHFMAEGLHTYRIWRGKDGSLEKAMAWGIHTEEGIYGLSVSGVKSYGDLSANYAGAQFWDAILDTETPYFKCQDGAFVKVREFAWRDYVTDAWDEAVNCSQFSPSMAATLLNNLAKKGLTCPVASAEASCRSLVTLPGSQWFVSPLCKALAAKSDLTTVEADQSLLVSGGGRAGE